MRLRFRLVHGLLLLTLSLPATLPAQTAQDSAQTLIQAALVLQREGRTTLARDLLQYVRERWPGTPAADDALRQLQALPITPLSSFGRTSFIAYHTLYGAFLGLGIPAAFDAEGPEPYGAGLLLGVPLGFFGSRAWGRSRPLTDGQAGIVQFGSFWGAWQGLGWQQALDIGEETTCDVDVCFTETSSTAPWAASILGSLAGLGVGLIVARSPIRGGTSSMIFHGSLWGTFYGVAAGIFLDVEDDDLLTASLIGGNAALLLALPLDSKWRPTSSRVRIASAGGLAGGLAGLGLVLLLDMEGEEEVMAVTTAGVTAGLILGASLGKDGSDDRIGNRMLFGPALLSGEGKLALTLPVPSRRIVSTGNGKEPISEWRVKLLDLHF